ncbi:MAG: PEP-CTERM sorting domain-containing protein [Opitutales bacterium]|nr:PEP-CTERM sorting domain-containing protein [Opitutales bacterium]
MKLSIHPLVLVAAAAILVTPIQSSAATVTQTASASLSVNQDYSLLPFRTFDSSLGTLTSVVFTINSASIGGSLIFSADALSTVSRFTSYISVIEGDANAAMGYNGLSDDLISGTKLLAISNVSLPLQVAANTNQTFTLTAGQSIISTSPLTQTLSTSAQLQDFIGNNITYAPTFILNLSLNTSFSTAGNTVTQVYTGISSTANVSLAYNYTPVAVPEPSTYGLVLGGLALAAVAVRRRKIKS